MLFTWLSGVFNMLKDKPCTNSSVNTTAEHILQCSKDNLKTDYHVIHEKGLGTTTLNHFFKKRDESEVYIIIIAI